MNYLLIISMYLQLIFYLSTVVYEQRLQYLQEYETYNISCYNEKN